MGPFDKLFDQAADTVQKITGEKERRQLVQEYKSKYITFKENLEKIIEVINNKIKTFNLFIDELNNYRNGIVCRNILFLGDFLNKFGTIKAIGTFSKEEEANLVTIPVRQLEDKENYIQKIDWSKEDVFSNTFFSGPIGTKLKTRKQNLSLRESLAMFNIEIEETLNQLELKEYSITQDTEIAELYFFCITTISEYIRTVIEPELEVVESFFQALKIKNELIVDHELRDLSFSTDIRMLVNTPYNEHYLFVKNVFMFYLISCKIFETPVLTKLVQGKAEACDIEELKANKVAVLEQKENVDKYLLFERGK